MEFTQTFDPRSAGALGLPRNTALCTRKNSQSTSPLLSPVLAPYEWRHLLPAARLLAPEANAASADANRACSRGRKIPMTDMTLAGLEPAIFGSEDQRLIH